MYPGHTAGYTCLGDTESGREASVSHVVGAGEHRVAYGKLHSEPPQIKISHPWALSGCIVTRSEQILD